MLLWISYGLKGGFKNKLRCLKKVLDFFAKVCYAKSRKRYLCKMTQCAILTKRGIYEDIKSRQEITFKIKNTCYSVRSITAGVN